MVASQYSVDRFRAQAALVGLVSGFIFLLLAFAPILLDQNATASLTKLFYLITLATMWNLLAGYAGMVSVGQQAYIGLGAYGIFVFNDLGLTPYLSALVASAVIGLIALPISFLAFRLRGGYFAIGTWVIAEAIRLIVVRFESLGAGRGRSIANYTADPVQRTDETYWLALGVVALALIATFYLLRSRLGLGLQAIRDDEVAARAMGVSVQRSKRVVFVMAAVGAAAAGGIITIQAIGVAAPNQIFSVSYSAFMIFMVLIGGIGTIEGPVVGAILYFVLEYYFSQGGLWYLVVVGLLAVLVTVFLPRGIWGEIRARFDIDLFPVGHRVSQGPSEKVDSSS